MFRSESMSLVSLFIPRDTSKQSISQLGTQSIVQFIDLNEHLKAESLPFTKEIKLLEKLKMKVKYLEESTKDKKLKLHNGDEYISANSLTEDIEKHFERIIFLNEIKKETEKKIKIMCEDLTAIEVLDDYLSDADSPDNIEDCKINLDYVLFCVDKQRNNLLERVLGQSLRNNMILHKEDKTIELVDCQKTFYVTIYVVFTHGKNALTKIEAVAQGLGGRIVGRTSTQEGTLGLSTQIGQLKKVFCNNERALESLSQLINGKIELWKHSVNKEMRIYQTMNKLCFEKGRECLYGQGWIRTNDIKKLEKVCHFITKKYGCITFEVVMSGDDVSKSSNDTELSIENSKNDDALHSKTDAIDSYKDKENNYNNISTSKGNAATYESIKSNSEKLSAMKTKESLSLKTQDSMNLKSTSEVSLISNEVHILEIQPQRNEIRYKPPTFFKTNKFTQSFQNISNVYGVPEYKEINPAFFYITTFPFMFGVMFGDIGHGIMLLLFALYLIKNEKTIKIPEFAEMVFQGRYLILMCSLWSIFFGFIYSDCLSIGVYFFKTQFVFDASGNSTKLEGYTYPFGIDPSWHGTLEGAQFLNSLKMKMSIIIAFLHMSLGIGIGFCNALYRKDRIAIFCVLIPQALAFYSFVGYLVFLIVYKWVMLGDHPSIISVLVSMFTQPFAVENEIYPFQSQVQLFLVCLLLISMPWMLLSKPMYETLRHRRKKRLFKILEETNKKDSATLKDDASIIAEYEDHSSNYDFSGKKREKHEFEAKEGASKKFLAKERTDDRTVKEIKSQNDDSGSLVEIWMHQCIETVEFGIGLVSNTSSYLRLWAISLAHSQLTGVLHQMTLGASPYFYIITVPIWLFFTVALLLGLEGLSSVLHALRLNWIEFNCKFFKGGGDLFTPLNYEINEDDE